MFEKGFLAVNSKSLYILGGIFFLVITWIYVTFYFQYKKHPKLLEHKIWRYMPVVIFLVGLISMILFIILVTIGPFLDWLGQGSWFLYIILVYAMILYYIFIITVVQKFNENKQNVFHLSYTWALGLLIVIAFLF